MDRYLQLQNRIIGQFDSLVSFIGLSHEEVFQLLWKERSPWLGNSADQLTQVYDIYRKQVLHSAFLLGYSYWESFLTDLLKTILFSRLKMLPEKRQLSYKEIIKAQSRDEIIGTMVNREILDLLYKSMNEIIEMLRSPYNFTINSEEENRLCKGSLIRNCIMHNACCSDAHLAEYDGFKEGIEFELSSQQIHNFGLTLRSLVRSMTSEAQRNHPVG